MFVFSFFHKTWTFNSRTRDTTVRPDWAPQGTIKISTDKIVTVWRRGRRITLHLIKATHLPFLYKEKNKTSTRSSLSSLFTSDQTHKNASCGGCRTNGGRDSFSICLFLHRIHEISNVFQIWICWCFGGVTSAHKTVGTFGTTVW